jgi:peroxiredoxin
MTIYLKKIIICFFLVSTSFCTIAQSFFRLKGNVKNLEEKKVVFTLYNNWIEEPTEYVLALDKNNNFTVDIPLNDIAYCDLNMGEKGIYGWIIEPNDALEINADVNDYDSTLKFSGLGVEKWNYFKQKQKQFEQIKDWDFELENLKKISKNGFFELTNYLYNEHLTLLNKYKSKVSEEFYSVARADIYGKISTHQLEYLVYHQLFTDEEFRKFQLKTINAKSQNKSMMFGSFIESLIDNHNQIGKKYTNTKLIELETTRSYFDKFDLIEKQTIDRVLASKILNYIDVEGVTEETKLMVASYKEFSKNKVYTNAIVTKFSKMQKLTPGSEGFNFVLPDEKGNLVSLKDFRGKNVFLSFFSSWCGPCMGDLNALKTVSNYFKTYNDLVFISIAIDTKTDFNLLIKNNESLGKSLNILPENKDVPSKYLVESVPKYFIINKTGLIVTDQIVGPSEDEGRPLIQEIERILYKK